MNCHHYAPEAENRSAFTLIELIMVIAILAIITVVGIQGFGNLKDRQAKKMNATIIAQTQHALSTYDLAMDGEAGRFNDFDSLIDVKQSGPWTGTPGECIWENVATASGGFGIYDGSWKSIGGDDSPAVLAEKDRNKGTRKTGLLNKLGIYFLTQADVDMLADAGISRYVLHNPSKGQSSSWCKIPDGVQGVAGGGPGFRPDHSAYYPAMLEEGSPVAVIKPVTESRGSFSYSSIYRDLGFPMTETNKPTSFESGTDLIASGYPPKLPTLICFGIGDSATCVHSQLGIGHAPFSGVYDKTHYRNYIAVFVLSKGHHGIPGTCHLAGVLDCTGATWVEARREYDWRVDVH